MARLCPPEIRRCVVCGAELPAHEPDCPLSRFENDPTFGSEMDTDEEEES